MKVKFLQDFRGRETNEIFYQAGDIADIDPVDLVKRGICKEVVEPKPALEVKEQRATASPTKKGKSK